MLTFLLLIFVIAPVSLFIHEIGHGVAALIVKADHMQIRIGTGKRLFVMNIGCHIQVEFLQLYFLGALAFSERAKPYTRKEQIMISIGGPIFNALVALLSYGVMMFYDGRYLSLFFLFNVWIAMMNMVPFKFKGKQSDGYNCIQALMNKEIIIGEGGNDE